MLTMAMKPATVLVNIFITPQPSLSDLMGYFQSLRNLDRVSVNDGGVTWYRDSSCRFRKSYSIKQIHG